MKNLPSDLPRAYRPLSAWGYVGYGLLFALPVIGQVLLLVFCFHSGHINRRSFARSYLCWALILILLIVLTLSGVMASILHQPVVRQALDQIGQQRWVQQLTELLPSAAEAPASVQLAEPVMTAAPTAIPAATKAPAVTNAPSAEKSTATKAPAVTKAPATAKATAKPAAKATAKAAAKATAKATAKPTARTAARPGVTKEFKETMDSYEAFYVEYVAFMKRYKTSNNMVAMMKDYTSMLEKEIEISEKLDAIDESKLNDADQIYFAEVSLRIQKLLLEAAKD